MVVANTPGVARPWTNRQNSNCGRLCAVAAAAVAPASTKADSDDDALAADEIAEPADDRRRHGDRDGRAVTVRLTSKCDAPNTSMSSGSSGWVA